MPCLFFKLFFEILLLKKNKRKDFRLLPEVIEERVETRPIEYVP
jgi:hypothetical protein